MILGRDWFDHYDVAMGLGLAPFALSLRQPTPAPLPFPTRTTQSTSILSPVGIAHYRHRAISEAHMAHDIMAEGAAISRLGCEEGMDLADRWRKAVHERTFASTHLDFRNLDRVDEFDSYHRHLTEASLDRHMPERARCRECAHEALPDSLLCLTCSRPERPFGVNGTELETYITSLVTWERLVQSTEITQREIQIEANTADYVAQRAREAPTEPEPDIDVVATPRANARRPLRASPLNLSLLSILGLLSIMSHAPVADARPVPTMESWLDLYEEPTEYGTPSTLTAPNGQPLLYAPSSLGVASLPGYTWGKSALLFALSSTSSGQHRLQTPLVCAVILFVCEQFVDTTMYYVGSQPPSTALYGYRYLTQRMNCVIPRGIAYLYDGIKLFRDAYGAPNASHVATSRVDLTLSTPPRVARAHRLSVRPWGSLVDLEISSLGLNSRGGFLTAPRIWAAVAVKGWLEMRVKVK